jgi:DNA-directed RNA polymerase beta' subunit
MARVLTEEEIDDILLFIKPNPYIPTETALVICEKAKDSLKKQIIGKAIYPKQIPRLRQQLKTMYFSSLVQPGESVGVITAQSIGEKQTQSNLNSVDWAEEIILQKECGKIVITPIGKFIDDMLASSLNIQFLPENRTEYLDVSNLGIKIPSCDEYGSCGWYKVEAVTRHLPVGSLVKITTRSGKFATVTRSKSLIVWNGYKFVPKNGSEVVVGDILPSTRELKNPGDRYVSFFTEWNKTWGNKTEEGVRDVFFDPIVNLEEVKGTCEYVYDLTVEKTRNFQLWNGLNVRDTFHKAGSSDKQPVVSKFSELLNATSKPKAPSYFIHFNKGNRSVPELRETIGHSLIQLTMKKITSFWSIQIDKEPEDWYKFFYILYTEKEDFYTDCISVEFNMDILYEYRLRMSDIAQVLESKYTDVFCIYSPDCIGKMDIYFDTRNIELPEEKLIFVTQDNATEIYLEEVVQPILENITVCGISGITNMFFIQEGGNWIVETENSREKAPTTTKKFKGKTKTAGKEKVADTTKRFKKMLAHKDVDMTKSISNNVWDIYFTFGIEAVRQYMIDEFSKIMKGINTCHVAVLVDKMTFLGTITSISRYAMRADESGPLGKASFEETLDNFLKAGVFGQQEPTRGVSASIICGKRAPVGTGMCELTMDVKKLGIK